MLENSPQNVNTPSYFLSDLSPKDVLWDNFKATSVTISNILAKHPEFAKRGFFMSDCAEWLRYAMTGDLDNPLKLRQANFCRDRACSICSWRRSLRWKATMHRQLPVVKKTYPTHRWVFVTLTVKNCDVHELRATIGMMNKGFNALVRKLKKRIGNIGYVKSVEVTRAKDDTAHPHFHVLFFVPASYFTGRAYLKKLEWVTLWQECAKLSYAPSVDVRAIYGKGKGKGKGKAHHTISCNTGACSVPDDMAIHSAVAETAKYATKSADLIRPALNTQDPYWWLYEYLRQVKGLRFISVGGCLKGLIKPEWSETNNPDELIYVDGENEKDMDTSPEQEILIQFNFERMIQRYWHGE